jgi:hypothetical protein
MTITVESRIGNVKIVHSLGPMSNHTFLYLNVQFLINYTKNIKKIKKMRKIAQGESSDR